ncbi:2-isopropylmalate synthase [Alphaproteobacteria bacterium]|nr:2-isopropylmalate synthase [Alphaproteobacteria bacterium]
MLDGWTWAGKWVEGKLQNNATCKYQTRRGSWKYYGGVDSTGVVPLRSGNGRMEYQNGDCYDGQWPAGQETGHGTMTYSDGTYDGQWEQGIRSGKGTMTYSDGRQYVGRWLNGAPGGRGKMTFQDKSRYVGQWRNGARHGRGKMTWPDGTTCDGQWQQGRCDGHCRYTSSDGFDYIGECKNDAFDGWGVQTYKNGHRPEGLWKDGKPHGFGLAIWPDGLYWCGIFTHGVFSLGTRAASAEKRKISEAGTGQELRPSDGLRLVKRCKIDNVVYSGWFDTLRMDGCGTAEYLTTAGSSEPTFTGESHTGEWKNSKRHGFGISRPPDGRPQAGYWWEGEPLALLDGKVEDHTYSYCIADVFQYTGQVRNGLPHGKGKMDYPSTGSSYDGNWSDGWRHGTGKLANSDRYSYEGDWKEGSKDGSGIETLSNGDRYDGQWKDGERNGAGIETLSIGESYDGQWKDGLRDGTGKSTYKNGDTCTRVWTKGVGGRRWTSLGL